MDPWSSLRQRALERRLRRRRSRQLERFRDLAPQVAALHEEVRGHVDPDHVRPDWEARVRDLERDLLPVPPRDFLRHPNILFQMFVSPRYLRAEMALLLREVPADRLGGVLGEDPVGRPVLVSGHDRSYVTSANAVHHLHHLVRFRAATGVDPSSMGTVVEWGGGYGSLARLFRRLHGGTPTYVVIDLPLFACLQWLYLSSVFGPESTAVLKGDTDRIVEGRFNLVPVGLVAAIDGRADLFVSTWALNESPPVAQRRVLDRSWFGADHLLLGMHRGDPLERWATRDGAVPEDVGPFMPAQRYLMR